MYMLRIFFRWQNSRQTRTLKLASTSRQIRINFASNSHFKFALQSRTNIASNIVSNSPTDTPSFGLSRPLKPRKSAIGRPAEVLGLTGAETQRGKQVDSKIITALLDFYTRAEVDQEIADALGNVDLSAYYTSAQTDSLFYPRAELDSLLTATLLQYWTSGRTQMEIDDAIAGAGFLTQAQADTRYFAVSANASFESLVRTNVTPPMIKALLPRAPLAASTILTDTTLELTCDAYTKAESDGRYLSSSSFAPLDARYFARNPAVAEGNGLFHLVQEQFTPQFIRSLLFRPPLTGRGILGNFSVIEVEADCWSKAQSDSRYPLVATFNSLGSTVTSIDGRVSTLETDVGAIDGRVTALENSGGVAPTADLTVNSLTAWRRPSCRARRATSRSRTPW